MRLCPAGDVRALERVRASVARRHSHRRLTGGLASQTARTLIPLLEDVQLSAETRTPADTVALLESDIRRV